MKTRALLRVLRAAGVPRVTQMRLARQAGIGTYRYWQIENGMGAAPTEVERQAIARALGVNVGAIAWPSQDEAVIHG